MIVNDLEVPDTFTGKVMSITWPAISKFKHQRARTIFWQISGIKFVSLLKKLGLKK